MTSISTVATEIIGTIQAGQAIYKAVVSAMDSLESVSVSMKGSDKKEIILSIIQGVVENAGQAWSEWSAKIADFIDHIKGLYNAVIDIANSFKSTSVQ